MQINDYLKMKQINFNILTGLISFLYSLYDILFPIQHCNQLLEVLAASEFDHDVTTLIYCL